MMSRMEVLDGPAVADHMALKSPFSPQNLLQQQRIAAARNAVDAVVGSHDSLHMTLLNAGLEGGKIGFIQVLLSHHRIEAVSDALRAAVYRNMLGAGSSLQEILVMALNALDEAHSHPGGQIGILPEGLMASAPSGIPENIHIGGPEGETLINPAVSLRLLQIELGPPFRGDGIRHLLYEFLVKGGG